MKKIQSLFLQLGITFILIFGLSACVVETVDDVDPQESVAFDPNIESYFLDYGIENGVMTLEELQECVDVVNDYRLQFGFIDEANDSYDDIRFYYITLAGLIHYAEIESISTDLSDFLYSQRRLADIKINDMLREEVQRIEYDETDHMIYKLGDVTFLYSYSNGEEPIEFTINIDTGVIDELSDMKTINEFLEEANTSSQYSYSNDVFRTVFDFNGSSYVSYFGELGAVTYVFDSVTLILHMNTPTSNLERHISLNEVDTSSYNGFVSSLNEYLSETTTNDYTSLIETALPEEVYNQLF